MIPHRTPFFLPLLYPSLVWRNSASEKTIYLTFDDGPVYGPTEFVLDVLDKYNIQATFFCIGDNVRKHPELFARIVNAGHSVGNHTFHHKNGWKTSTTDYLENIEACQAQLNVTVSTEITHKLFRPPYGRITRVQIAALKAYKIIMWDVLSQDYRSDLSVNRCLTKTIKATRPGSIVVFHDSKKAERNLTGVLPTYIEHFLNEGYRFKAL